MNRISFYNRFPILKITLIAVSALCITSCQTMHSGLQQTYLPAANTEQEPQFIEDFYTVEPGEESNAPRLAIVNSDAADAHHNELITAQKESPGLYSERQPAGYNEYENSAEDIGGQDYATPEEAEEFEVYDELFLFNELNAGESFDPTKMTDSVAVYLISPWSSCYTFPLQGSKVNSDFGWRRSRFHSGIDLDLEIGDQVVASFDGIVKKADYISGYGNLVVIKHFNGLETYYAHLSKITVAEGDTLNAGDQLGLGGTTGRSTGPHLHYEIRYRGAAIDPKNIVDFKSADIKSELFYLKKEHFRPAENKSATAANKYYTVRKGDTLSKIASRNGTTVSKICKLNGISSKKILKPGMKLRIR